MRAVVTAVGSRGRHAEALILVGMKTSALKPGRPARVKPPKLSRADKAAARIERRTKRRETFSSMGQAFTLTRKNDKKLIPYLVLAFVLAAAVVYLLAVLITNHLFFFIPLAVVAGLLAALFVFSRRAQNAAYSQADGQPGAALYVLRNLRGADWKTTEAVAASPQLDAVHRLTGRPGLVLVGEGSPQRVKGLIAQEKRRLSRLIGDTPIYDVVVGGEAGQVPLGKLNGHLIRLPSNLSKDQVAVLNRRLAALPASRIPVPQGPMPAGAKMNASQRAMRRRAG